HLLIRRAVWIWIRGEEFSRTLAAASGAGELLLRLGVCPHHCVGRWRWRRWRRRGRRRTILPRLRWQVWGLLPGHLPGPLDRILLGSRECEAECDACTTLEGGIPLV
uniref:Uncharacterized protein n=1 Tax=Oryza rufipogon TaxID=4529 RepID=A0A0E0PFL1_ORYRU